MKKLIYTFCFLSTFVIAQEHPCSKNKIHSVQRQITLQARMAALSPQISHELKYDLKFVHLDLNVERINKYISGGVKTIAKVVSAPLDTFMTLLHQNFTIDSIRFNGVLVTAIRQDSIVKFKTPVTESPT